MSITASSATTSCTSTNFCGRAAWIRNSWRAISGAGWASAERVSPHAQRVHQLHSHRALRCNLARQLLREDYRSFAARLADSPLLQYFCGLGEVGGVKIPSKSTLQRYDVWWNENRGAPSHPSTLEPGGHRPAATPSARKRSIWKAPFWTPPAWRPISTIRSIGSYFATPPAP